MRKSGDNMFETFLETFWTPTIVGYQPRGGRSRQKLLDKPGTGLLSVPKNVTINESFIFF